nr:hypothetical protein [uncultured Comamonas sp.]
MIKSYGIPGASQETRTEMPQHAPYLLMATDRPEPHYIVEVVGGMGVWVEPPAPVPPSCTNRQAKLALIELGFYTHATDLLAAITDPVAKLKAEVEWNAPTFERGSPFLNGVWEQLGGTQEQLDDAFRLAVTL